MTDLHQAASYANAFGNPEMVGRAFARMAVIHAGQGRLREAEQAIEQAQPGSSRDSSFLALARALVAVERLHADAGSLIGSTDLDNLPDPYWPLLLLGRARWAMAHGAAAHALEIAAVGRTTKQIRPLSLADSTLLAIRAASLVAMGSPSTVVRELVGTTTFATPELELARSTAEIGVASSLRALGVIRRLSTSEEVGPSVRAEAMLISLQSDPLNAITINAVRTLVGHEGVRRVVTTAPAFVARQVWPNLSSSAVTSEAWSRPSALRASEKRVLEMLAAPGDMAYIANRLNISINTLKTHTRTIYRKLDVRTRDAAVTQGYLRGILVSVSSEE